MSMTALQPSLQKLQDIDPRAVSNHGYGSGGNTDYSRGRNNNGLIVASLPDGNDHGAATAGTDPT